jgi:hypothetical protein
MGPRAKKPNKTKALRQKVFAKSIRKIEKQQIAAQKLWNSAGGCMVTGL